MIDRFKPDLGLSEDPYIGYLAVNRVADLAVVNVVKPITTEELFSDESKRGSQYDLLKKLSNGRYTYLLDLQLLSGSAGQLTDVPFAMPLIGAKAIHGGIPTIGQIVLVFYIGDRRIPYCIGGAPVFFVDRIADGTFPILKPGEQIVQSEILTDPLSNDPATPRKTGARAYWDYKGRIILEAVQDDGTIDGTVKISLGNPVDDFDTDEEENFPVTDPTTEQPVVFRLETASGVTINIDSDGNVHSSVLKDYIKECVNETLTVSGKHTLTCTDINLGSANADQSLVLGEILLDKLSTFIDIVISSRHLTKQGPTIKIFPADEAKLIQLKSSLEDFLSHIARTQRE